MSVFGLSPLSPTLPALHHSHPLTKEPHGEKVVKGIKLGTQRNADFLLLCGQADQRGTPVAWV